MPAHTAGRVAARRAARPAALAPREPRSRASGSVEGGGAVTAAGIMADAAAADIIAAADCGGSPSVKIQLSLPMGPSPYRS